MNIMMEDFTLMPPVTRAYCTACVLTTVAVQFEIVTPFQLYYNSKLIFQHCQLWRLVTNLCFFGTFGFGFFFNLLFTYRYCRMLEENSFRGRTSDFVCMFLFGAAALSAAGLFMNIAFLSQAFTIMIVYVWSRRNPFIRLNFFGLLTFQAPYLPWVLMAFSFLFGGSLAVDLLGIAVGHLYFFLEDVFPGLRHGFKILHTPAFLKSMLDAQTEDANYNPLPREDRPGLNWAL